MQQDLHTKWEFLQDMAQIEGQEEEFLEEIVLILDDQDFCLMMNEGRSCDYYCSGWVVFDKQIVGRKWVLPGEK